MPVVCIVDITAIGNARLRMNMIYRMQIKKASIIAFSKCDLLTDAPDRDRLMEQFISAFPEKQNCLIQSADLYQELMKIDSHVKTEKHEWMLLVSNQDLTASIYQETTYQFGTDKFFDTEKLTRFFKNHSSIIRAKGFVKTMSGWNLFNFTLSGCTFEPCLPKTQHDLAIIVEQTQQIKVAFDNKSLLHELVLEATTPANMAISF
jgi:G3E family GTPase